MQICAHLLVELDSSDRKSVQLRSQAIIDVCELLRLLLENIPALQCWGRLGLLVSPGVLGLSWLTFPRLLILLYTY